MITLIILIKLFNSKKIHKFEKNENWWKKLCSLYKSTKYCYYWSLQSIRIINVVVWITCYLDVCNIIIIVMIVIFCIFNITITNVYDYIILLLFVKHYCLLGAHNRDKDGFDK